MPNWCYNKASITGNKADVEAFIRAITVRNEDGTLRTDFVKEGRIYDLTRLHPVPEPLNITAKPWLEPGSSASEQGEPLSPEDEELIKQYEANMSEYGFPHWYYWCLRNWGTKWPPQVQSVEVTSVGNQAFAEIAYETAWSPADALMEKLSEEFTGLRFVVRCTEEAHLFIGASAYMGGLSFHSLYDVSSDKVPEPFRGRLKAVEDALQYFEYGSPEFEQADDDFQALLVEMYDYSEKEVLEMLAP
jgi:hypothetical protein